MKYCAGCGSEYQDTVKRCADCQSTEFRSEPEVSEGAKPPRMDSDTRRFVRAGTAEDPLTADRLVSVLESRQIPVFSRARRAGTVDALTGGETHPWWELLVPEECLSQATALIAEDQAAHEADAEDAAKAAEEEEAETERRAGP